MKNLHHTLIFALTALLFAACNPSMQSFKKGDYYEATIKAVRLLRNNPESKNAIEVIQKSYPMELDYERQRINELSISNHPDKFLNIVETYTRLNNLADEISRCPAALELLKPVVFFHTQLQKAEELALDEQYDAAMRLLESNNYLDARLAVQRLEWVKQKNPEYSNIDERVKEAKNLGTLRTVVELKPELHANFDINSKVFYLRLFDFLDKRIEDEYIKFYQPDFAEKIRLKPHEIVTVQFIEFQISNLVEREKESKYESDSIVVGTFTDSDGSEHNVSGTVKASVSLYERELVAKGILEIKIMDYTTNEIIVSQKFPSDYIWKNEWASYNGDERAVPSQILNLSKVKQQMPPAPQEMFLLLSDPILNNATQFLKSYYKKK